MLANTLIAVAAAGWSIGAPPAGDRLLVARQYDGWQKTLYGHNTHDFDDAPIELTAYDAGRSMYDAPPAAQTTVHGQPAEFSDLTDDGETYGRQLRWIESSGVTLVLGIDGGKDAQLETLAESVKPEPPERWEALQIATSAPPSLGHLPAGMKRAVVRRGHGYTLTALLPPGFPVAPEDRRAACYVLRFHGHRSYGSSCNDPTSWKRVGGTIFAFGEVPANVRRIRVRGSGVDVRAGTGRARGYPLAAFYAVALPDRACSVVVTGGGRVLGETGPAVDGSKADRRRCR
ncbi:hypothetical protein [Solirubrobacter soli]|uniref:hypothetical protein n=1 Tax=Solirubrobacter soli TaxID=363832 RepID=UPI0004013B44|nr:hypothetical protein [Solirubrobacter soli]